MSSSESSTAVRSAAGTTIAFDRVGDGPPLILVDAAGHFRGSSSFGVLIGLLAGDFSVCHCDRRGRGESGDSTPYQVAREGDPEDGAARDADRERRGPSRAAHLHHGAQRAGLGGPTRCGGGVLPDRDRSPGEMVAEMRGSSPWAAMESVAHTLVYDSLISQATSSQVLASVTAPTLVLASTGSDDDLTGMAATVAAAIPGAEHLSLPGGWYGLDDEVVAQVLADFLLNDARGAPR